MKYKLKLLTDSDGIAIIDVDAASLFAAVDGVERIAKEWIRLRTKNTTLPVIKVWWSLFDESGNDIFYAANYLVLGNPNYVIVDPRSEHSFMVRTAKPEVPIMPSEELK